MSDAHAFSFSNKSKALVFFNSIFSEHQKFLNTFADLSVVEKEKIISKFVSRQFASLFSGYTQAYNLRFSRHGSLFSTPYKRIEIMEDRHLKKLVHYIHYNPIEAGLSLSLSPWKWSSYDSIVQYPDSHPNKELINLFSDLPNFVAVHKNSAF